MKGKIMGTYEEWLEIVWRVDHRYYVYVLCDSYFGEVVYVGKGSGNRAWSHNDIGLDNPNKKLALIWDELGGFTVKILVSGLTHEQALDYENYYITHFLSLGLWLANTNQVGGRQYV
jgi:hypothetical protein